MSTVTAEKTNLLDYIKIQCNACETRMELKNIAPLTKVECPECSTTLRIPLKVGDLLLEQRINSDDNFTFYRGTDLRLNRPAVIKVINKSFTSPDEIYSFGIGSFVHENVSSIYSVNIMDDTYHLITENIIGQTLEHYLQIGDSFDQEDILGVAQQVTETLKDAAAKNIHHGHLSMDAIWVSTEGDCKVADFGIRQRLYTQDLKGKEEQIKKSIYFCEKANTPEKIDLYSLGVCLHKLSTGEFPLKGVDLLSHSIMPQWFNEILDKLVNSQVVSFQELEKLLENEGGKPRTEAAESCDESRSKSSQKSIKINTGSTSGSQTKNVANTANIKKINVLKRKLLISRLFFAVFVLISIIFLTSRYLPSTPVGKFSESILNNTLDKAFAKEEPVNEFDNVMDILQKK